MELTPLFGDLDARAQDAAVAAAAPGRRKVVLATALAESSLTIDGIEVVIDAGWSRVSRFDPSTGLARLLTEKAAVAQADQRRGRAGRLGPGVCWRLWTAVDQQRRPLQPQPEILSSDPAPLALELALWGQPRGRSWRSLTRRLQDLCSRPRCCCRSWAPCCPMANPPPRTRYGGLGLAPALGGHGVARR